MSAFYVERVDKATGARAIEDGRITVGTVHRKLAGVAKDTAITAANAKTTAQTTASELIVVPGAEGKLAWQVLASSDKGSFRTLVDAGSGAVIKAEHLSVPARLGRLAPGPRHGRGVRRLPRVHDVQADRAAERSRSPASPTGTPPPTPPTP